MIPEILQKWGEGGYRPTLGAFSAPERAIQHPPQRSPKLYFRAEVQATFRPSQKRRQQGCETGSRELGPEADSQYSPFSPGGRVFHLRCTHSHCSGYFRT